MIDWKIKNWESVINDELSSGNVDVKKYNDYKEKTNPELLKPNWKSIPKGFEFYDPKIKNWEENIQREQESNIVMKLAEAHRDQYLLDRKEKDKLKKQQEEEFTNPYLATGGILEPLDDEEEETEAYNFENMDMEFDPKTNTYRKRKSAYNNYGVIYNAETGQFEIHQDQFGEGDRIPFKFDKASGTYKRANEIKHQVDTKKYDYIYNPETQEFVPIAKEIEEIPREEQLIEQGKTENSTQKPKTAYKSHYLNQGIKQGETENSTQKPKTAYKSHYLNQGIEQEYKVGEDMQLQKAKFSLMTSKQKKQAEAGEQVSFSDKQKEDWEKRQKLIKASWAAKSQPNKYENSNHRAIDILDVGLAGMTASLGSLIDGDKDTNMLSSFARAEAGLWSKDEKYNDARVGEYTYQWEKLLQTGVNSKNKNIAKAFKTIFTREQRQDNRMMTGLTKIRQDIKSKETGDYSLQEERERKEKEYSSPEAVQERMNKDLKKLGFVGDMFLDPKNLVKGLFQAVRLATKGSGALKTVGTTDEALKILKKAQDSKILNRFSEAEQAIQTTENMVKEASYVVSKANKAMGKMTDYKGITIFGKTVVKPELIAKLGDTSYMKAVRKGGLRVDETTLSKAAKKAFKNNEHITQAIKTNPKKAMEYIVFKDKIQRLHNVSKIKDKEIFKMVDVIEKAGIKGEDVEKFIVAQIEKPNFKATGKKINILIDKVDNPEFQKALDKTITGFKKEYNDIVKEIDVVTKQIDSASSTIKDPQFVAQKVEELMSLKTAAANTLNEAQLKGIASMDFSDVLKTHGVSADFDLYDVLNTETGDFIKKVAEELKLDPVGQEAAVKGAQIKQLGQKVIDNIEDTYPGLTKYFSGTTTMVDDVGEALAKNISEASDFMLKEEGKFINEAIRNVSEKSQYGTTLKGLAYQAEQETIRLGKKAGLSEKEIISQANTAKNKIYEFANEFVSEQKSSAVVKKTREKVLETIESTAKKTGSKTAPKTRLNPTKHLTDRQYASVHSKLKKLGIEPDDSKFINMSRQDFSKYYENLIVLEQSGTTSIKEGDLVFSDTLGSMFGVEPGDIAGEINKDIGTSGINLSTAYNQNNFSDSVFSNIDSKQVAHAKGGTNKMTLFRDTKKQIPALQNRRKVLKSIGEDDDFLDIIDQLSQKVANKSLSIDQAKEGMKEARDLLSSIESEVRRIPATNIEKGTIKHMLKGFGDDTFAKVNIPESVLNPANKLEARQAIHYLEQLKKKMSLVPNAKQKKATNSVIKALWGRTSDKVEGIEASAKKLGQSVDPSKIAAMKKQSNNIINDMTFLNSKITNELDRDLLHTSVSKFLNSSDSTWTPPVFTDKNLTEFAQGYLSKKELTKALDGTTDDISEGLTKIIDKNAPGKNSLKKLGETVLEDPPEAEWRKLLGEARADKTNIAGTPMENLVEEAKGKGYRMLDRDQRIIDIEAGKAAKRGKMPPKDDFADFRDRITKKPVNKTTPEILNTSKQVPLEKPRDQILARGEKLGVKQPLSTKSTIQEVLGSDIHKTEASQALKDGITVRKGEIITRSGKTQAYKFTTKNGTIKVSPNANPEFVNKVVNSVNNMDDTFVKLAKDSEIIIVDGMHKAGDKNYLGAAIDRGTTKQIILYDQKAIGVAADNANEVLRHELAHVGTATVGDKAALKGDALLRKEIRGMSEEASKKLAKALEKTGLPNYSMLPQNNLKEGFISSYPLSMKDKDFIMTSHEHLAEFAAVAFNDSDDVARVVRESLPESYNELYTMIDSIPSKDISKVFKQPSSVSDDLSARIIRQKDIIDKVKQLNSESKHLVGKLNVKQEGLVNKAKELVTKIENEDFAKTIVENNLNIKPKKDVMLEVDEILKVDSLKNIDDPVQKEVVKTIKEQIKDWGLEEGTLDPVVQDMTVKHGHFTHMLTKEATTNPQAILSFEKETGQALSKDVVTNPFAFRRKYNKTIKQVNEMMYKKYGVEKFFETNVAKVYLERGLAHNKIMYDTNVYEDFVKLLGEEIPSMDSVSKADVSDARIMIEDALKDPSKRIIEVGGKSERVYAQIMEDGALVEHFGAEPVDELGGILAERFAKVDKAKLTVEEVIRRKKGNLFVIDNASLDMYKEVINKQIPEDTGVFLKAYDRVLQTFKQHALMSPGYHRTNILGNYFNSFESVGTKILHPDIMSGTATIQARMTNEANPLNKLVGKKDMVLGKGVDDWAELLQQYGIIDTGQYGATKNVGSARNVSKWKKAVPFSKDFAPAQMSQSIGTTIENNARISNFLIHVQDGKSYQEAADLVNKFLFDYGDLSQFETRVMKRFVPFYTFMRKNAPLQLEQLLNNPGRVAQAMRIKKLTEKQGETEEQKRLRPDYTKGFSYKGVNEDGKATYKNYNTPFEEAFELLDYKKLVGSTSPLLKAPLEMYFNKNIFFDSPISYEKGSKVDAPLWAKGIGAATNPLAKLAGAVTGKDLPTLTEKTPEGEKMDPYIRYAAQNLMPTLEQYSKVGDLALSKMFKSYEIPDNISDSAINFIKGGGSYTMDEEKLTEKQRWDLWNYLKALNKVMEEKGYERSK